MDEQLRARARAHGIETETDGLPVPESTLVRLLAAVGPARRALVARPDAASRLDVPAGARVEVRWDPEGPAGPEPDGHTLPAGMPLGVHEVIVTAPGRAPESSTLVVAPARVPQPARRQAGILVQLYSVLSAGSWGIGDLGDLATLAANGEVFGADFVQVNPLHAAIAVPPAEPSPYRPATRFFTDPLYLRVPDLPEFATLPAEVAARLAARGAALTADVLGGGLIDRDAVWALKREALELLWPDTARRAEFRAWREGQGEPLIAHATWCALAETLGADRSGWPVALRDARGEQVAAWRAAHADLVDFHAWLCWLADTQLAAARAAARGMGVGIVLDLAVGAHPGGSDAWALGHLHARGMSIGAPPDYFNARGQDWGLPPWRPDVLAEAGFRPWRLLLRRAFAHAGALRLDHVMGLFRQWWVPAGLPPTEGAYLRYDAEAMLAVLALEAERAGALVIGEDLGTVEPGVREALAARGVLGTSVLWFEKDAGGPVPRERWRRQCLATVTTHDLPSTAARLTGEHVALRHRLGLLHGSLAEERAADAADRDEVLRAVVAAGLLAAGDVPPAAGDAERVARALYRYLAGTGALLVGLWLPDAVGDRRPQNVPGTVDEYPNWRLPLADAAGRPVSLDGLLERATRPGRVADLVGVLRRGLA